MDYHPYTVNGYGTSPAASALTSPTQHMKCSAFASSYAGSKSSGQPSPSSVLEELHGRFQNAGPQKSNQRPILRNSSTNYSQRKTMPSAMLTSQPYHHSELTLPTSSTQLIYPVQSPRTVQTMSATSRSRLGNMEQVLRPPESFNSANPSTRGGKQYFHVHFTNCHADDYL